MYGSGVDIDFVLVDDASTDRTWYLIEKWIEHNREYFRSTVLLKNERNRGTSYSYCKLIENVKTEYFIKIDGDDLFSSENIISKCFEVDVDECIILLPFRFNENGVYYCYENIVDAYFYANTRHTHKRDLHVMETIKPFMTPQVIIKRMHFTKECLDFVKKFVVFEDDPSIFYILRDNNMMKMKYLLEPFVLYRVHNKSVSNGVTSISQLKFLDDLHMYNKYVLRNERNIFVKAYLLFETMESFLMKHRFSANNCPNRIVAKRLYKTREKKSQNSPSFSEFIDRIEDIKCKENDYLNLIYKRANSFGIEIN